MAGRDSPRALRRLKSWPIAMCFWGATCFVFVSGTHRFLAGKQLLLLRCNPIEPNNCRSIVDAALGMNSEVDSVEMQTGIAGLKKRLEKILTPARSIGSKQSTAYGSRNARYSRASLRGCSSYGTVGGSRSLASRPTATKGQHLRAISGLGRPDDQTTVEHD